MFNEKQDSVRVGKKAQADGSDLLCSGVMPGKGEPQPYPMSNPGPLLNSCLDRGTDPAKLVELDSESDDVCRWLADPEVCRRAGVWQVTSQLR